jgi:hypothetical protein
MGATFIFSYGRSRHEVKKGDRQAAADMLRYARANRHALGFERICKGQFLIRHPAKHTTVRINVADK